MRNEYQLTVAEVLKRPLFQHAELIAGKRGITRSIRWVHILETAENGHFLNGGELILSSGVGFGCDHEKQFAYLTEVIHRKAIGLCIELGTHIQQIPQELIELADHYEFPLLVFHKPVRFVDITLDLHECIVNQHTQMLRLIEAYSREMQQLSLQIHSLPRLLQHFQSVVQNQTFFISLEGSAIYAPAMTQAVQVEFRELFLEKLASGDVSSHSNGQLFISDKKQIIYQPVKAMEHVMAYVGVVLYDHEPDNLLLLTLDYTVMAMAQILLRKMFAEERLHAHQGKILDDILQEKVTHEEQIRHALGVPTSTKPEIQYLALIIESELLHSQSNKNEDLHVHDMVSIIRSICSHHGLRCYLLSKGNRNYLLLLANEKRKNIREQVQKAIKEIQQLYEKSLGSKAGVHFGVSRVSTQFRNIRQSFHEAEQIADQRAFLPSFFYDDLGVHRILLQLQDHTALESFIQDYLGPLILHDKTYGSELVKTLRVFLDYHGSKQEAANQLFIRRQSLYHRLEKIEELIGKEFLQAEHRISLELALRAYEWFQRKLGDAKPLAPAEP